MWVVKFFGVVFVVFMFGVMFVIWLYFLILVNFDEFVEFWGQNEKLWDINQNFEVSICELQVQFVDYEDQMSSFVIVVGFDDLIFVELIFLGVVSGVGGDFGGG